MSNQAFIQKFTDEIKHLILERERADSTNRKATKGDMMEETIADLFSKYFPYRCGFGKGEIHDSFGNKSKEVDIVVFDRDSIPPICHGEKTRDEKRVKGFFPVESLWYAVEVKKTLNSAALGKAIKNMSSVKLLKSNRSKPIRMLFAYGSDLSGDECLKEFDRYKKNDSDWKTDPAIHVFCILGKGYFFMNEMTRKTDQKKVLQWRCTKTPLDYFEAACCIAGMINTITGQTFGSYLFDEFGLQVMEEIEL